MALGKAYVGVPQHSVKFFQVMQARLPNVSGNFALIAGESRRTSQSFPESPPSVEDVQLASEGARHESRRGKNLTVQLSARLVPRKRVNGSQYPHSFRKTLRSNYPYRAWAFAKQSHTRSAAIAIIAGIDYQEVMLILQDLHNDGGLRWACQQFVLNRQFGDAQALHNLLQPALPGRPN